MIICDPNNKESIPSHKWFAWYPVWASDGTRDEGEFLFVWLESVWRERRLGSSLKWRYRRINKSDESFIAF